MTGRAESRTATAAAESRRPSRPRRRTKPPAVVAPTLAVPKAFAVGTWPILALGSGQCRFACTPHGARRDQHRFCGEPTVWRGGKPTSWCAVHLARIFDASNRAPEEAPVRASRSTEEA